MTRGVNPSLVSRDHFGWTGRAYRPSLAPGRLTFVRARGEDVRTSALLSLAVELLSAPRLLPSDAAVAVYTGAHTVEALKVRLLCLLIHSMPPDPAKLRKAREVLADMRAPTQNADPWLRSQVISEDVRLLAGMWSLAEVADYVRDPACRSQWPDRARLDAARDVYDGFRDRLVLAPGSDLPRIDSHARSLRASRPVGAILIDSSWDDPAAGSAAATGDAPPTSLLRAVAEEVETPVVATIRPCETGSGAAHEDQGFAVVDIAEGTVVGARTLMLLTLRGAPTGILAFDARSATFRKPIPGEFDELELLGPLDDEL